MAVTMAFAEGLRAGHDGRLLRVFFHASIEPGSGETYLLAVGNAQLGFRAFDRVGLRATQNIDLA
jgi:hypothetical protein